MAASVMAATSDLIQAQTLCVDLFQAFGWHALEQGHAAAKAVLEVGDFAAHGCFGDGGHLGLFPDSVGDLIDALDVDQGGVHVEGDGLERGPVRWWREALDGESRCVEMSRHEKKNRCAGGCDYHSATGTDGGVGEGASGLLSAAAGGNPPHQAKAEASHGEAAGFGDGRHVEGHLTDAAANP